LDSYFEKSDAILVLGLTNKQSFIIINLALTR